MPATTRVAYEDVNRAISRIAIHDAAGATLTITLAVDHGTLKLRTTSGLIVTGNGSGSLTLYGITADLNAALATLVYRGPLNYKGNDSLRITATEGTMRPTVASVGIKVVSSATQAANLRAQVTSLRNAGVVRGVLAQILTSDLTLRQNSQDVNRIQRFITTVNLYRQVGIVTPSQAAALLGPANILLQSVRRG